MKSNVVEKFNQDSFSTEKGFRRREKPKFDWAGGLKELRDEHTSVELQEKASVLRAEGTLKPTRQRKAHSEVF